MVLKIDIDAENFENPWDMVMAILKSYSYSHVTEPTYYTTHKGAHIVLWNVPHKWELRLFFSDDPYRLERDMRRAKIGLPICVAFQQKRKGNKIYVEERVDIFTAIDHLLRIWRERKREERKRKTMAENNNNR